MEGVNEKQQQMTKGRGHAAKKVISLTQIHLCTFFL